MKYENQGEKVSVKYVILISQFAYNTKHPQRRGARRDGCILDYEQAPFFLILGIVERAKRERARKSPHRVSPFSRGVIFTRARVSLALLWGLLAYSQSSCIGMLVPVVPSDYSFQYFFLYFLRPRPNNKFIIVLSFDHRALTNKLVDWKRSHEGEKLGFIFAWVEHIAAKHSWTTLHMSRPLYVGRYLQVK